jgi:phage tail tape-measure protein
MNQNDQRDNFDEHIEESGSNQADSLGNQGTSDVGEVVGAGTLTDAIAGAMIGSPFGLIGTVVGGVSGGVIGNQMVEGDELDKTTASKNREESKD